MEEIEISSRQIMLVAFGRLRKEDKTGSTLRLTQCILHGTSIPLGIGDIDWETDRAIQQYGGVSRTGYRYMAYFHFDRSTEMAEEIHDKIVKELCGQKIARRRLEGHFRHSQRCVRGKKSCHTQVAEMDRQKTLTLDFTKSLMEPAYTLIWTGHNGNLDNHCGLIQECLDNKSREHSWERTGE